MFHRTKIKPSLPAQFHEVSCLFKRWVWVDVADEGQMWITTERTLSFFRVIESYSVALQTDKLICGPPLKIPFMSLAIHTVLSNTLVFWKECFNLILSIYYFSISGFDFFTFGS